MKKKFKEINDQKNAPKLVYKPFIIIYYKGVEA